MKMSIECILSNNGRPCLWEKGGAERNSGEATIICGSNGEKKEAIKKGHESCGEHALIPVGSNDIVIIAEQRRGEYKIQVYKIHTITLPTNGTPIAQIEKIYEFDGVWDQDPPDFLDSAINAAFHKGQDYHCRAVYFAE